MLKKFLICCQEDLEDLNLGKWKPKLLEYMISIALDHKATHREMTSVLISDLYGKMLNHSDMGQGFDELLSRLSDLTIDTPDAPIVSCDSLTHRMHPL